jgi:diguanylate cyclase (GGDEF)-like protein
MAEKERNYTVLVVEDDAHTRELLVFTMEEAGHLALSAGNGVEALKLLDERVVDIVICDIMMPGMNGFALREALVSRPKLRDIGFIFLSAKSMPEDEIKGLRYGVDEYITKPFNPDVLVARVEAVLTRRATLARAAQLDSLTQLYNRQTGEREVQRELERLQRYPSVAALAFVDIDDFKEINDAYLHVVGDRALVSLAEVFKQNIRSVDIAVRYGGDEFVLFFPETGEEEAVRIIERMQRHFQRVFAKENHVLITFSAGVVEVPRDGDRFEVLCERADQAMYTAKRGGKARVLPWRQHMKAGARHVWTK